MIFFTLKHSIPSTGVEVLCICICISTVEYVLKFALVPYLSLSSVYIELVSLTVYFIALLVKCIFFLQCTCVKLNDKESGWMQNFKHLKRRNSIRSRHSL